MQFYPGDWMRNANLRRCTHAERGAWVDIMCLMHDSENYGILYWPMKEICESIRAKASIVEGLVSKGVMKGVDSGVCAPYIYIPRSGGKNGDPVTLIESQPGPIWYSSRMVRDEYVRLVRSNGKQRRPPNGPPKPPFGATFDANQSLTFPAEAKAKAKASLPRDISTALCDIDGRAARC